MTSPRRHHRRRSMEEPVCMLSDVVHLREELNRLHMDISPECNKHIEKMSDLINEFELVYMCVPFCSTVGPSVGEFGVAVMFAGLALFVFYEEVSSIIAGAGAGMAAVGGFRFALGRYRKIQHKKNLKRSIEEELKGIQDKISPIIDIMDKICQRAEEILRYPLLSDHTAQALSEHFGYSFENSHLFQEHDRSAADDWLSEIVHLSGNLSEMIAKVSSVSDILIIEDNKRQHDKPAKPTCEQINKREFKEKAEKLVNDMQTGICEMKNRVKGINQIADIISNHFKSI